MFRSLKLGTAFGIPVYIHWTFFLLPLAGFFANLRSGLDTAVYAVAMMLALVACVVLHEFGHALTARRFGIPTIDITMYPIGGVARLGMPKPGTPAADRVAPYHEAWVEFWVAVAGPAVNVVIAVLLGGILALTTRLATLVALYKQGGHHFLFELLALNIALVIFNMIPAFPMDGGRVLRALLSVPLGALRATEVAATLGAVLSLSFIVLSFFGNPVLLLIGVFVFFVGQQELMAIRQREAYRLRQQVSADFSDGAGTSEHPGTSDGAGTDGVDPAFTGLIWDPIRQAWVLWRHGRPVRVYPVL